MTSQNITRYVRFSVGNETPRHGIVEGDTIHELEGDIFNNPRRTGRTVSRSEAKLHVPLDPKKMRKVIGIATNFTAPGATPRIIPHGRWFSKAQSALNTQDGEVECPPDATNFNYEGEVVLVIGKKASKVSLEDAPNHIFGITIGNDYSENTWIQHANYTDGQSPYVSKATDSWASLYTDIVTGLSYDDLGIEVRLNGNVHAKGRTRDMNHMPAQLINYLSHFITLLPGDVIYTGTVAPQTLPGLRKQLQPGDVVEVEIEGIGTLRNKIVPMKGESTNL